jgi:hypothetical protein
MHWENFRASCCSCVWLAGEPEPAAFVLPAAPLDVAVPTLATDGNFEPPHPVSATAAAAARYARPHVVVLLICSL